MAGAALVTGLKAEGNTHQTEPPLSQTGHESAAAGWQTSEQRTRRKRTGELAEGWAIQVVVIKGLHCGRSRGSPHPRSISRSIAWWQRSPHARIRPHPPSPAHPPVRAATLLPHSAAQNVSSHRPWTLLSSGPLLAEVCWRRHLLFQERRED